MPPTFKPITNPSGSLGDIGSKVSIAPGGQVSGAIPASLKVTKAPTSPITTQPVGSFGSGLSSGTNPSTVSGLGSYKGVTINPGDDIAAVIARVDAGNPTMTSSGSVVSADRDGNVVSPTNFRIDMSGGIKSDALGSSRTMGDVADTRKSYYDYVMGLSKAMEYSPEYLRAYEELQGAKAADAEIQNDFYTGRTPGATVGFSQGVTARRQSANELVKTRAAIELGVQELVRQGNIEGAKALVSALAPQTVAPGSSLVQPTGEVAYGGVGAYSDYQAQQTYFNLAQTFPDAQIPAYDPNLSAQQNLQRAQQLASNSPSFASRNLIQVTDPSGAIYFVQKNQLQTNPDGSFTFISPGNAAGLAADRASLAEQTKYLDTTTRAVNTADANFKLLTQLMEKAKINQAGSPIINQLNNRFQAGVIGSGDVAAFRSAITALRQEYAQVLSRGGQVTNEVRDEAERLIPENLTLNQLRKVEEQIRAEGANIIGEAEAQIQAINGRLQGGGADPIYVGGGSAGGGGDIWSW